MKTTTVTFKTKTRTLDDGRRFIVPKASVKRSDCNLKPHEHAYYNSNLFEPMLNRAYQEAIGQAGFLALDNLPSGVTVEDSGFLAVVTVELNSMRA